MSFRWRSPCIAVGAIALTLIIASCGGSAPSASLSPSSSCQAFVNASSAARSSVLRRLADRPKMAVGLPKRVDPSKALRSCRLQPSTALGAAYKQWAHESGIHGPPSGSTPEAGP